MSMPKSDNFRRVAKVVADVAGVPEKSLKPTMRLFEDLQLDSLDAVELGMAIEEEFGVDIPEDALDNVETVQNVVELVGKYL